MRISGFCFPRCERAEFINGISGLISQMKKSDGVGATFETDLASALECIQVYNFSCAVFSQAETFAFSHLAALVENGVDYFKNLIFCSTNAHFKFQKQSQSTISFD